MEDEKFELTFNLYIILFAKIIFMLNNPNLEHLIYYIKLIEKVKQKNNI